MKFVRNNKLFVDFTNIMVVHIMNNEIGCFNQFILREWVAFCYISFHEKTHFLIQGGGAFYQI